MRGKRPTVAQRKFIEKHSLNSNDWLVQKDTTEFMQILHRYSDKVRVLKKQSGNMSREKNK